MKALSIHQPWAWKLARGHKTIECRNWFNPHRGLTVIHATLTFDKRTTFNYTEDATILGSIIGYAYLKDIKKYKSKENFVLEAKYHYCEPPENYNWDVYGWMFNGAQVIDKPIPCRGWPKLWTLNADLEERLKWQMP